MSEHCCPITPPSDDQRFRRALLIVLAINLAMFFIEVASGIYSGSLSLLADAIDFLGDSCNYVMSLYVLKRSQEWRSGAALVKAAFMLGFAGWVLWSAYEATQHIQVPQASVMGAVGFLALLSNAASAWVLFAFRTGDSNRRSIWLCTRNDVIGNALVMLAAAGVFTTLTAWPDLLVASMMAALALSSAISIIRQAILELRSKA